MNWQMLLFTLLTLAAIALAIALILLILRLKKTIELMESRMDDAIRQFEITAEDLRKTNAVAREILQHTERGVANVAQVTESVRGLRRGLDAATKVMDYGFIPFLGTVAGGMAGVKAAISYALKRYGGKES